MDLIVISCCDNFSSRATVSPILILVIGTLVSGDREEIFIVPDADDGLMSLVKTEVSLFRLNVAWLLLFSIVKVLGVIF